MFRKRHPDQRAWIDDRVKLADYKSIARLALGYLCIGFAISLYQNIFGALTVFTWTGLIAGNLILLFWWLIVAAVIWPWNLFWSLFYLVNQ